MGLSKIVEGMGDCFQNIFYSAVDLSNSITENQIIPVDNAPAHPKFIHTKPKTSEFRGQYCLLPLIICQFLCDESLERHSKFATMGLQNRSKMTPLNSPRIRFNWGLGFRV